MSVKKEAIAFGWKRPKKYIRRLLNFEIVCM